MRQSPLRPIFTDAQQFLPLAQLFSGQVVECVHLVSAPSGHAKSQGTQLLVESTHIVHPKLNLDFPGHKSSVLRYGQGRVPEPPKLRVTAVRRCYDFRRLEARTWGRE